VFFSPDSRHLVRFSSTDGLTIYDGVTGQIVQKSQVKNANMRGVALSTDNRTIALDHGDGFVQLIELSTGAERQNLGKKFAEQRRKISHAGSIGRFGKINGFWTGHLGSTAAFSPDGRLLTYAGMDNALHIWNVATGEQMARFEGHSGVLAGVAFAPNGRSVTTASSDTTALIWDVGGLSARAGVPPRNLDEETVKSHWNRLASDDARAAYAAINALVGAPRQTLSLLKQQLKPFVPADPDKTAKLLTDLESSIFKARESASKDLEGLGWLAEPALREALKGGLTLETRRRIEAVLQKLPDWLQNPDHLRTLRALEVVERIGTQEARGFLRDLSKGAPGARLTVEAQRALSRLD
jgi:hypothetical protein